MSSIKYQVPSKSDGWWVVEGGEWAFPAGAWEREDENSVLSTI